MWSIEIYTFLILRLSNFLENERLFQKTVVPLFLVASTKIENASVPYKTAMSEVNVKANRIESTKYHKKRIFASNFVSV